MPGALETDRRTLDEDLASSHRPLLSLFHRAPAVPSLAAQASGEPGAEPPGFLASSPITALAGTEPATQFLRSLVEVQPGATPGPVISITLGWGLTGLSPPCCTALGKLPDLSGVPKGLCKLPFVKPQAEGQALSSLGLCGQLNRPQPPQLERPCRMMLTSQLRMLPDLVPTPTLSLSGHATLARHRSSLSL